MKRVLFLVLLITAGGCAKKEPVQQQSNESSAMDVKPVSILPPNDPQALKRLVARINKNGDINNPAVPNPLVSLEEFFEGNNDYGSIGYNFYPDQPTPAEFYAFFKQIQSRPGVADVLVQVCQHEEPEGWPSSDTIWIITSVGSEQVKQWLGEKFRADDLIVGWPKEKGFEVESHKVPEGMQAIGIWWD